MFSKVFKVEKKSREVPNSARPASTEQRPTYYPLLQSSLHSSKKRATVHDTRASSIEKDLDLLELVCRSDSLHKRLDELQAKYERMDDGIEQISCKETKIKESKSEKRNRQKSNLINSSRISKSFEEPEVKKPSFFKRIFGNRLSKSEDDLLEKGSQEPCSNIKQNGTPIATPPLKDRRSASADILSIKDLAVRPPDKRYSCSVEFADLSDRNALDDCLMPPPPPPPPDLNYPKSGMKRKRVIKMYNIDPLDQQNSSMGGSSESCYDSTDSELDVRSRRASDCYNKPNHIYASSAPSGETQHCRHHSLQNTLQPLQQHQSHVHDGMLRGDPTSYSQYDLMNTSGRSSRSSYYKQSPLISLPVGKMPQEADWPVAEVGMSADNEGEWYGKDGGMIREGKWPIIDGGRTIMREGEWRAKADSWSAGEGERTTKEGVLLPREVIEGGMVTIEGVKNYEPQAYTNRNNKGGVCIGGGGGGSTISLIDTRRPDMSKRCGGVYTDEAVQSQESWDTALIDGESTKDGTVRRRYSYNTKKSLLCKSPDGVPSPGNSQKQTPSPKDPSTPMDCSDTEKQMDGNSDVAESSETELPLSKASSTQDLPTRLPTTASIQELDHFLSAIIHNLEAQLQSGGSISIKGRPAEGVSAEALKRKRKKRRDDAGAEARIPEMIPLRTKKMSECGACGRRWVEPRLLPCLHTVCTPCLHARAAHIPNPNTSSTPIFPQNSDNSFPAPPQPYDGKITHSQSSPLHSNRPPSQERTITPTPLPVPPPPTVIPPTPNHSPSTPSPSHRSPSSPSNTAGKNLSEGMSLSCGNLSRHWNGDSSGVIPGDSNNNSAALSTSQFVNGNQTSQQDLHQHYHHHHCHHHQSEDQLHHDKLAAASEDLDSVIELLTNLNPNAPHNAAARPSSPKMPTTPTPSPAHTPTDVSLPPPPPPPTVSCMENDLASPSSTLDSRGSSKTRSSRRSSSSESVNRNRGIWVVWCHECGFEAQVPPGGVECFPLNYILQKQLVLEALNSSSTTVFCDLCQEDVVAEERCDTCPVNLCRLCSRAHTRQRRTNHHKVISLQEARSMGIREVAHTLVCATHGEGEVGWWCRGCQEPLCASCLATMHRGHPTVTVDQEAPNAKSNLTSLLDLSSNRMGELLSTVEDLTGAAARVQQRGRAVTDQVNAFIDDYVMALEEHRHTLLRQIRQACERAQRGIVTESQKAGQNASWLRQGCDLTHDLLHHAGDAETLALAPVVTVRLQRLLNEDVRGWARWERLTLIRDHRAGKVRGHRLHGVIADTPAHPPSSRLKLLGDVNNLTVGTRVSALVVARDVDGQPITHGGEDVGAMVLTRDGNILCSCSVRDREDGSYEITFSPPVPMAAMLKVTIQGAHVQDSPLDIMITTTSSSGQSNSGSGDNSTKDRSVPGRQHTGIFHCCTFCSSSGDKTATCACGATMPGGYMGCGHNHSGHPGKKHWSCCAQTSATAPCTRPPSQYYQVTL